MNIDIQIETEIQSLNMLARKHSKESEIASYVLGITTQMLNEVKELKNDNQKRQ